MAVDGAVDTGMMMGMMETMSHFRASVRTSALGLAKAHKKSGMGQETGEESRRRVGELLDACDEMRVVEMRTGTGTDMGTATMEDIPGGRTRIRLGSMSNIVEHETRTHELSDEEEGVKAGEADSAGALDEGSDVTVG